MHLTLKDIEKMKEKGTIRGWVDKGKAAQGKKSKYRNTSTVVDGIKFQSKREASRYKILLLLQKKGEIGQLRLQVKYELIKKNDANKSCSYIADFTYIKSDTGETVVEDSKGVATAVYVMKRKLMFEKYGIKITEV